MNGREDSHTTRINTSTGDWTRTTQAQAQAELKFLLFLCLRARLCGVKTRCCKYKHKRKHSPPSCQHCVEEVWTESKTIIHSAHTQVLLLVLCTSSLPAVCDYVVLKTRLKITLYFSRCLASKQCRAFRLNCACLKAYVKVKLIELGITLYQAF